MNMKGKNKGMLKIYNKKTFRSGLISLILSIILIILFINKGITLNNLRDIKTVILVTILITTGLYELHISLNKKHSKEYEKENDERMTFIQLKSKSKVADVIFYFTLISTIICAIVLSLTHNMIIGGILLGIAIIPTMMIILEIIFLAYYDK